MKKFLVNFIIGVVLMAIGTTALIFELNEFEYVDNESYAQQSELYTNETISMKDKETLQINFLDDDYGYSYTWNYDDSLKDEVKLSFAKGVDYRIQEQRVEVIDTYDASTTDLGGDWKRFNTFIEGLKKRKIYSMNDSSIIITTAYKNRENIHITHHDD